MEVITAFAKNVYGGFLPQGVEPKREIPVEFRFNLNSLNPGEGYVVTPVDELFRKTSIKLGIPVKPIRLSLPRSNNLNSTLFPQPLRFWAGNGDYYDKEILMPSIGYDRHLSFEPFSHYFTTKGGYCFDFLDTENISLETLLKESVMSKPEDETLKIYLKQAEILLHVGNKHGDQHLELRLSTLKHLNKKIRSLRERFSTPTMDLRGKRPEECVNITEEILNYFISQNNS